MTNPQAADAAEPLSELTSLRFVAAFAVLLLHYRDQLGPLPPWLLKGLIAGQYGVTFFFVLSGFILTYRYNDWFAGGVKPARYAAFQRFRFARLYPVYLVGLLLDTPWHLIASAQAGQLGDVAATYWASWLINLVGLQAWVPAVPFAMFWNTPAWSVAAEFFFYASFPFVCARLARPRGRKRLLAMLVAVVAAGIALYAAVIYTMNYVWHVGAQAQYIVMVYNPVLRFSEFLAGCLAGQLFLQHGGRQASPGPRRRRDAIVAACLALVLVRVAMPDYTGPNMWYWLIDVSVKYGFYVLPFTAMILCIASGPTFLSPLLTRPGMVLLGEASYALYIVHWPVLSFLRLGWLGAFDTPFVHALFMLATVGLALLCLRWVEVPWRRRLRGAA